MRKIVGFFFTLILISIISLSAQGLIIDKETGKAVPNTLITDQRGTLLYTSDANGRYPLPKGQYHYRHIGYDGFEVNGDTIYLHPKRYAIPDVVVSSQLPPYVELRTYIQTYQYIDSVPISHTEGIVSFYVPTKGTKLRYAIESLRVYKNNKVEGRDDLRKGSVDMLSNGWFDWLLNPHISPEMGSEYFLSIADSSVYHKGSLYEGAGVGLSGGIYTTYLDMLYPEKEKHYNLFGRATTIDKQEVYQKFPQKEDGDIRVYDILSYRFLRSYTTQYKSGKRVPVQTVVEFDTLSKKFLSKEEYKTKKTTNYWGNFHSSISSELLPLYLENYQGLYNVSVIKKDDAYLLE